MQQTGQAGSFKAPQNRAELEALMRQRDELRGQLSAMEDRRAQLVGQRAGMDASMTAELYRRIKTLDASIDRVEARLTQANDAIVSGQARFGGSENLLVPPPGSPVPMPVGVEPVIAVPSLPPPFPGGETDIGRPLLLGGLSFVLLGAITWVWMVRRIERRFSNRTASDPAQISKLQQSVDAIAVEVERISENQRWVTKQMNERGLGAGEAKPVNVGNAAVERVPRKG